jgi:alkanesulfonate monooxygenase SsuD/methylene tetrahydromethanopterin reductase-like flavin-dependent oxidoreductase (luciferase family)
MLNFGTFLLMQSPSMRSSREIYSRAVDIAQAAEALGFRNVWLAEHHFSTYGYLSRPAQLATYLAAKTTTLRVGTAVIVVPLHHPLVVAEEIATLDQLGGGRVDIGLGRGYQHYEFERLGLELDTARARWEESVDIILRVSGQALPDPRDHDLPAAAAEAAPAHLGDRAEPRVGRGHRAARLQPPHRGIRRAHRAHG